MFKTIIDLLIPKNRRRIMVGYSRAKTPDDYVCSECGAKELKLWRKYQSFDPQLRCAPCAAVNQSVDISNMDDNGQYQDPEDDIKTDQIGWYVPAIPTEENDGYWGYTSVPENGIAWWKNLPTFI